MKIARPMVVTLILFGSAFVFGCVSQVGWQTDAESVPSTYQIGDAPIERSIGKLKRLVLVPARFHYESSGPFLETLSGLDEAGKVDVETAAGKFLASFADAATTIIVRDKGYQLATWRKHTPKLALPSPDSIKRLADWAYSSTDGAATPEDVARTARSLGDLADADGIMVIQGRGQALSDEAYLAVLATASLLWPLVLAETKVVLEADIYETASGNLVWRSRASSNNAGDLTERNFPTVVYGLFETLEHALPTVFIDERR